MQLGEVLHSIKVCKYDDRYFFLQTKLHYYIFISYIVIGMFIDCDIESHTNIKKRMEGLGVRVMVFNTTFNNISIISWWSVLLLEETAVPGENHRPVASH